MPGSPTTSFQTLLIGSQQGRGDPPRRPGRRGDADRQRGGRRRGRPDRRRGAEEGRPGARRLRPVRGDADRPTSPRRPRWPPPRAARTTASPASPPSGSSCTPTCTTSSSTLFAKEHARPGGRRPDGRAAPTSARWPPSRAATTSRRWSRTPSTRAPRCSSAASGPTGPAGGTRRPLVAGITEDMDMYPEEVFGPVAAVYRVADIDEAVAHRQRHPFGLGSNAWTNDPEEQAVFVRDLEAGPDLHQRHDRLVPRAALRRHQGLRPRPRARRRTGSGSSCNVKTVWVGESGPDGPAARSE